MNDFVSGGQITLHSIRMFGQVMQKLCLCAVLGFLVVVPYWFFHTVPEYGRHLLRTWLEAEIKINLHGENDPELNSVKVKYIKKVTFSTSKYNPSQSPKQTRVMWVEDGVLDFMHYFNSKYKALLLGKIYQALEVGCWASLGMVGVLMLYFQRRGIVGRLSKYVRGGSIVTERDLLKHIRKLNKKVKGKQHRIAGIPYPYKSQEQNTLVIGSTGVGKTQLISDLVEQIRKQGERLIIFDKKCDYLKWFYDHKKDYILNPFDKRGVKWNLLVEIDNIGLIKTIAESFIPQKHCGGESKIWDEAGRLAFTEIVKKIISEGKDYSNQELVDMILRQDLSAIAQLVKGTDAQSIINMDSPKTASSVLFVLASHFNSLRLSQGKKDESFSIRKWLEEDEASALFITSASQFASELNPLNTAWFEIIINGILSGKQNTGKRIWVILDELATLHQIPSLQNALATGRSYGACFVLGLQNIAQMKEIYGMNNTNSISSECNTRCIFGTNDPMTAKWAAENIGDEEIIENRESLSYGANEVRDGVSINTTTKVRPLVLASELLTLKRLTFYLKMVDCPIIKKELKYKEREVIEENQFVSYDNIIENLREIETAHEPSINKGTIGKMGFPFKVDLEQANNSAEYMMQGRVNRAERSIGENEHHAQWSEKQSTVSNVKGVKGAKNRENQDDKSTNLSKEDSTEEYLEKNII